MCTSITPFSALTACFESVMAHETKSTHRYRPQLAQKCVSFKKQKAARGVGCSKKRKKKTTAAQTKAPKGGLSFGWTAFKNAPSLL